MNSRLLAKRLARGTGHPPLEEAFLKKDMSLVPNDIHLIWKGAHSQNGYGVIAREYVHKLLVHHFKGIPYSTRIYSICEVPLCVNPHHWEGNPWTLQDVMELLSELQLSQMPDDIPPKLLMEALDANLDNMGK